MISKHDMRRQTAKAFTENMGSLLLVGGSTLGGGYLGGKLGRYLTKSQLEEAQNLSNKFDKSLTKNQRSLVNKINKQKDRLDLSDSPYESNIRSITLDQYMLEFTDSLTSDQTLMYNRMTKLLDGVNSSVLSLSIIGGVAGLFFGKEVHELIKSHLKK